MNVLLSQQLRDYATRIKEFPHENNVTQAQGIYLFLHRMADLADHLEVEVEELNKRVLEGRQRENH